MWIYQENNWPNFTWDGNAVANKLAKIRYRQGYLLGRMAELGFEQWQETHLNTVTSDIIKSSAIEGEKLNPKEVRSSIARRLGIDIAGLIPSNRNVDGMVSMMLDATLKFAEPLTEQRLYGWHAALFPTGWSSLHQINVGSWRTAAAGPMQVVSGPIGKERIHFEAPCADQLTHEMALFLQWINNTSNIDYILMAGIAHLWFVTIHPFEDGNGRIARAISDFLLARADGKAERCYSLSTQIEAERKSYYHYLEQQQRGSTDITTWLQWFLDCLDRALSNTEQTLDQVIFKAQLWNSIKHQSINERQQLIINKMLEQDFIGHMNTAKYAKLAKCSKDTALRDIVLLKQYGILQQNSAGGRSTSYRLTDKLITH